LISLQSHITPASLEWSQLTPLDHDIEQFEMSASFPEHCTSDNQTRPLPLPNNDPDTAFAVTWLKYQRKDNNNNTEIVIENTNDPTTHSDEFKKIIIWEIPL
jgi:hypothetical protein